MIRELKTTGQEVDISTLPGGLYFLRVGNDLVSFVKR